MTKREAIAGATAVNEARVLVRNVLREWCSVRPHLDDAIDKRLHSLEMLYHTKAVKLHERALTPRAKRKGRK